VAFITSKSATDKVRVRRKKSPGDNIPMLEPVMSVRYVSVALLRSLLGVYPTGMANLEALKRVIGAGDEIHG